MHQRPLRHLAQPSSENRLEPSMKQYQSFLQKSCSYCLFFTLRCLFLDVIIFPTTKSKVGALRPLLLARDLVGVQGLIYRLHSIYNNPTSDQVLDRVMDVFHDIVQHQGKYEGHYVGQSRHEVDPCSNE